MADVSRRTLLAATGAALACPSMARADGGKPRVSAISQWSAGSDGTAIKALGKLFEENGGIWQHNPVPGFTKDMINKLRAQIMSGDPPAASQLKGREIAAWSKIAPCVDHEAVAQAADYEKFVAPELVKLHKPFKTGIVLPLQLYRINPLFASKRVMAKVGATTLPTTWVEFNDLAARMKAAGITPLANGGIRWDDGMKWEITLNGISPAIYCKAVMELDAYALASPDVLAAFEQTLKLSDWMSPSIAAQSWSVQVAPFIRGDMGMLLMGGWAQGNIINGGFSLDDFLSSPAPQNNGRAAYIMNADAFIFWKQKADDLQAGQMLLAKLIMQLSAAHAPRRASPRAWRAAGDARVLPAVDSLGRARGGVHDLDCVAVVHAVHAASAIRFCRLAPLYAGDGDAEFPCRLRQHRHFRRLLRGAYRRAGDAFGDPAGPARARRKHHSDDVSVSNGGIVRRQRHDLELAPQPRNRCPKVCPRFRLDGVSIRLAGGSRHGDLHAGDRRGVASRRLRHGAVPRGTALGRRRDREGGADRWRGAMANLSPRGVAVDGADVGGGHRHLLHMAIKTFDLVRALTGGGPGIATNKPATVAYDFMFQRGQLGRGAAAAILMFMALVMVIVPYKLYQRWRR